MFRLRNDDGAIAVIVAMSMTVILAMAALVVDVGAIQARRAQLQEAADAASLALARQCATAAATNPAGCASTVLSGATATAARLATANLGDAVVATPVFTASTVTVTATSTQVGIFAGLFGSNSKSLTASATAQWTLPVVPLPLAYQECALPAPSSTAKVFLRSDILSVLDTTTQCGLLGSTVGLLGARWTADANCSFDVDLLTYVGSTLSNVLPPQCAAMVPALPGQQVIVPVYSRVLGPIVINGVLMGNGYAVQKYALIQLTGYDFQSVSLAGISTGGPKSMPGNPQCPTVLGIEEPLCQGLQGYLLGYLTPAEAKQRIIGVTLIA